MWGFNVTAQSYAYDNRPVVPLYNMPFSQWWMVRARAGALGDDVLTSPSTVTSTTRRTPTTSSSSPRAAPPRSRSPATRATRSTMPHRRGTFLHLQVVIYALLTFLQW